MLPVVIIASDGVEVEIEAAVSLHFYGYLAVSQQLANSMGWRSLGGRRVRIGNETVAVNHYLGMVALGGEPATVVILGSVEHCPLIGQRLMSGRKLNVDFKSAEVTLE